MFFHVHTALQNHNQLSMLVRRGLSTRVWKSPLEVQRSTLTRCTAYPRFWIIMCGCTDCRPEMTPMDLVRVWQFTTTDSTSYLTMTWLWLYHDMTIRWPWHEHDMTIPWQWYDSDMSMIWSWLDLTWTWPWHDHNLIMKLSHSLVVPIPFMLISGQENTYQKFCAPFQTTIHLTHSSASDAHMSVHLLDTRGYPFHWEEN